MELMWILAAVVAVVVGAVGWVLWRNRDADAYIPPSAVSETAPKRTVRPTWGKQVVVPDHSTACEAVLKIAGQSFPGEEAPRLPLPNCNAANCKCYYIPARERRLKADRRSGMDRRTGLRYEPGKEGDRRSGKDRRHSKHYHWDHTI